jgi:hypothetical protein
LAVTDTVKIIRSKDFMNRLSHKQAVIFIIVGHEQDRFPCALLDHVAS